MSLLSKSSFLLILLVGLTSSTTLSIFAQEAKPTATPAKGKKQAKPETAKEITGEQIAESSIFYAYGLYVGGRQGLDQIRKTSIEIGKVVVNNSDGTIDNATYIRRIVRGENLEKDRIRLDQEFPNAKFTLINRENKLVGIINESVFTPRDETAKAFTNQAWHGLEGFLRYKENGSSVKLAGKEKLMGVEYFLIDVTDKQARTTKYYVSAKTFRVMSLEYTDASIKYTRRFYDYRYAQGTLVPYRNILFSNGKQIEETTIQTVTYGQKMDEDIFLAT